MGRWPSRDPIGENYRGKLILDVPMVIKNKSDEDTVRLHDIYSRMLGFSEVLPYAQNVYVMGRNSFVNGVETDGQIWMLLKGIWTWFSRSKSYPIKQTAGVNTAKCGNFSLTQQRKVLGNCNKCSFEVCEYEALFFDAGYVFGKCNTSKIIKCGGSCPDVKGGQRLRKLRQYNPPIKTINSRPPSRYTWGNATDPFVYITITSWG